MRGGWESTLSPHNTPINQQVKIIKYLPADILFSFVFSTTLDFLFLFFFIISFISSFEELNTYLDLIYVHF